MDSTRSNFFRKTFLRREWLLVLLIIVINVINANLSPYYLNITNLFDMTFSFMEKGFIVLIMALIMITGNIDISVASNIAMSSVVMAISYQSGLNMVICIIIGLLTGTLGGFINGYLITKFRLASIVVTLGTMSLYRGISFIILGDQAVTKFPEKFAYIGQGYIGDTPIPFQLVVFIVLAIIFSLLLHKTTFGRHIYSIGINENACRYSGVPVDSIKLKIFAISGFLSALAAIFLTSRIGVSRPSIAIGYELEIITIVVLGGVSMYGGEGTIPGVVLSLFLVGFVRYGLSLKNVPANMIIIIIGLVLIFSVMIPNVLNELNINKKLKRRV